MGEKWTAVKFRTGTEVHLGPATSNFALCNVRSVTFKVSDDVHRVTCKKCRELAPGAFKDKEVG
jgi:hypothetical protein